VIFIVSVGRYPSSASAGGPEQAVYIACGRLRQIVNVRLIDRGLADVRKVLVWVGCGDGGERWDQILACSDDQLTVQGQQAVQVWDQA
jgi:hypothetical protein